MVYTFDLYIDFAFEQDVEPIALIIEAEELSLEHVLLELYEFAQLEDLLIDRASPHAQKATEEAKLSNY